MSELTPCNFCTLRDMRQIAKKRGATVTVTQGDGEWKGWLIVQESDQPKPTAYFMALTKECVC